MLGLKSKKKRAVTQITVGTCEKSHVVVAVKHAHSETVLHLTAPDAVRLMHEIAVLVGAKVSC